MGHAHPRVTEAIRAAVEQGTVYGAGVEEQVALARELVRRVPSCERVRFCNSGTEATLFALRAARAYTGRSKIIKMEGGYHGTHDSVEYSVRPSLEQAGPAERPQTVPQTRGLPASLSADVLVAPFNDASALEGLIAAYGAEVAAVIIEPVMGAAGFITPKPEYLSDVRELTRRHAALLVFDEVVTLRLAPGGAQRLYGVTPDLKAMGKIIGGGLPVGAFGGRQEIMDVFNPTREGAISHTGTFNGNRATMAGGIAVLEELGTEAIDRINAMGERLRRALSRVLTELRVKGQVTGVGSLLHVHLVGDLVEDFRDAASAPSELVKALQIAMLNRGVFIAQRGMLNVSTPMGEPEMQVIESAFRDALLALRPAIEERWPRSLG